MRPQAARTRAIQRSSYVEAEVHHVAVLDDVILALEPHLARFFRALLALAAHEIIEGDDLGTDESLLEVGMDHARGLRRRIAVMDRPGTDLLRPGGEVRFEPEQRIPCMDHA